MIDLVYHASYSKLALPQQHGFPITKYQHLFEYLLGHKLAIESQFHQPQKAQPFELKQIHSPEYVTQFVNNKLPSKAIRRIGFPWSEHLKERTLYSVNGTYKTTELALQKGIAIHLSGGYHHAHYAYGSGYCIFNDLYFAAHQLLHNKQVHNILIFDCDVHQGDGTAALASHAPEIITASIHCDNNFPSRKQNSDYDFALPAHANDQHYLETVEQALTLLIRLHQPDIIIYDAGVDIHQDDRLGHLNITDQGLFKREQLVLSIAQNSGIPIAAVIGGGYDRNETSLSQRHSQLFKAANQLFA